MNDVQFKASWTIFINHYMETGDHVGAYKKAYPQVKRNSAATRGKILLQRPEVAAKVKELAEAKEAVLKAERERLTKIAAQDGLLAEQDVDRMLCAIISGTHVTEKIFLDRGGNPIKIKVKPTLKEQQTAMDMYYKRFGKYPPVKLQHAGEGGGPIQSQVTGSITHNINFSDYGSEGD